MNWDLMVMVTTTLVIFVGFPLVDALVKHRDWRQFWFLTVAAAALLGVLYLGGQVWTS